MFREKINFKNSQGLKLSAIFERKDIHAPIVVMCHGFQSSKDNPKTTVALAQKLIESRLCVFRFDFTGHGQSEGDIDEITPLKGLDDLKWAVRALNKEQFALYGSSFGGYVALLYACHNPVLALALKAPVSDWNKVNISTGRGLRFRQEVGNIDIYHQVKNIKKPTLVIHGDKDDVVLIAQSYQLLNSIGSKNKKLEVVPGADHDIAGEDLVKVNTLLADFFAKILFNLPT